MSDASHLPGLKPCDLTGETTARLKSPANVLLSAGISREDQAVAEVLEICPEELKNILIDQTDLAVFLKSVLHNSPYLKSLALEFPVTLKNCHDSGFEQVFADLLSETETALRTEQDRAALMVGLRGFKKQGALLIGLADLGGWWSSTRVGQALSDVADLAVEMCVRHLLLDLHEKEELRLPDPENPCSGSGYGVIAMGKHGAGELNYSSDIDLVVIFDSEAEAIAEPEESVKLFVRMTRELMRMLQERTADGYVFRTDLRLRPDPSAMPLAIPLSLALTYYEARGQNWERAAMIKARAVAGDIEMGNSFLVELVPFIWRRYLDYAAIADIHSIKRQLQSHRGYDSIQVAGHNVKLGQGGIREIEFFVQTQQLIAGGRMPQLRGRRTLQMLESLRDEGWIEEHVCRELTESYLFLRDVEHRLQMIDDAQTHEIEEDERSQARLAVLCGFETFDEFAALAVAHFKRVHKHYSDLFSAEADLAVDAGALSFTGDDDDPGTLRTLAEMGFENPKQVIATVRSWHYGRFPAMQSTEAREMLTELTPQLLASISRDANCDHTLLLFDEFLKGLPAGIQLFSILNQNRNLLKLLLGILASAPRLAGLIRRRPHVFDAFLELGSQRELPTRQELHDRLARTMMQARSDEEGFDRARLFVAEHRFLIGLHVFGGILDVSKAGAAYSELAECLVAQMFDRVRAGFESQHGRVPNSSVALVGLGNLGDRELTATSDLDLLVLYEFDPDEDTSDGSKPLHASQYFGRLTQRFISAMSAPTAQGVVYELDMRLRPYGSDGPVATSLRAFQKHHDAKAETWEKLALIRARILHSDPGFDEKVQRTIRDALSGFVGRNISKDVLEMRLLMDRERPARDVWNLKLAEGGLIDLEFLVQWIKLSGAVPLETGEHNALRRISSDLLQNDKMTLVEVLDIFRGIVQLTRLCLEDGVSADWPEGFRALMLKHLDVPDMNRAEAMLGDIQSEVRATFLKILKA